jgi:DNA-binding Lrp family transcriptional regulator
MPSDMQAIYFTETKRKLKDFFNAHNAGIERLPDSRGRMVLNRKKALGPGHMKCVFAIIEIFAAQLNKIGMAALKPELPNVFTSNGQLAQMIHASPRTVQRYIQRLQQAGIITGKSFHGSTHAFELCVNPQVIHLAPVLTVAYINTLQNRADQEELRAAATSCLHTETEKINKKLIRAEELLATTPTLPINNSTSVSLIEKSREATAPGTDSVPSPGARASQVTEWGIMLFNYCLRLLYFRIDFLSDSEKKIALSYFIRELLLSNSEKEQKTIFHALKARIELAGAWLRKDERRYIPVPSKYFDPANSGGFTRTKIWLQKTQKPGNAGDARAFHLAQKEVKVFNRYMNFYLRNRDFKTFRYVENFLQKKKPEMIDQFYELVIEDQHGLNHISQILKLKTA